MTFLLISIWRLVRTTITGFVSADWLIQILKTVAEIGHFGVPLCLCFKASLSAKTFLWVPRFKEPGAAIADDVYPGAKHNGASVSSLHLLVQSLNSPYFPVGEKRVQDNLHAHAQNAAIFSPQIGGKPY